MYKVSARQLPVIILEDGDFPFYRDKRTQLEKEEVQFIVCQRFAYLTENSVIPQISKTRQIQTGFQLEDLEVFQHSRWITVVC
jgi:hypothetical protein